MLLKNQLSANPKKQRLKSPNLPIPPFSSMAKNPSAHRGGQPRHERLFKKIPLPTLQLLGGHGRRRGTRFFKNNPLPDLITSDVMMPNMDGFTLRQKINEQAEWKTIPFVLLTARTLESDKLKGFQLGIDDYVTKPFSLPELEARIHNLLKNKEVRREALELSEIDDATLPFSREELLLQEAEKIVLEKMDDPQFSVEVLAKQLGYSQRQLGRVFSKQTGLTLVKFILELRLQKARQLLESRQFATVTEVRYEVGIESASYFTKKFTERFGKNPKAYLERN